MPSKKILTLFGMFLALSSNVLIAAHSNAADPEEAVKSQKLVSVTNKVTFSSEAELEKPYFLGADRPQKVKLSREELLKQAALRSINSLSVSSKPVRLFVDEDEQPLASDLKSFFAQYNRGDA